jgi:uncharacterized protein DUF6785/uncharacterized protein DUF6784
MSTETPQPEQKGRTWVRILMAAVVGLIGSVIIWVAAPYNSFVMNSQFVADSFLPVLALFLLLLLVLVINPLFRKFTPKLALSRWQMAIVLGMMLVASSIPSSGMLRQLPYSIARVPYEVKSSEKLDRAYKEMDLPPSLFPDGDKMGYKAEVPAAEDYIRELPEGGSIPWKEWVGPLLSWGSFLICSWLMMIGLSLIVLPQWRRNERLPFPLLTVQDALIETPERGHLFAPLFRKRSFWIAAGVVFTLHFLVGMNKYYPNSVPAIPINWNLGNVFAGTMFRHLPGHIRAARLYFIFVGITFFMPNRIAFSIWFFELAYAIYGVFRIEFAPPYNHAIYYEHRVGAMLVLSIFILWLGRSHWLRVFRNVWDARTPEDRRNRNAALMFSSGMIGMYAWLLWVGVMWGWALLYVGIGFMVSLLITRLVAETGMSFIRIDFRYTISAVKLAPMAMLNSVSLYFATVIAMLFPVASRTSTATLSTHALGLDEKAKPRFQTGMSWLFMIVLVIGLLSSGMVHLNANYNNAMPLDGADGPLSPWGTTRITQKAHPDLIEWQQKTAPANPGVKTDEYLTQTTYNQVGHLTFGAALCAALEWCCLRMPKWPLHPVGLIMNGTFYANQAWASVLLGWILKLLLVKYGGARLYRAAKPVFLGLIMGEVFAAVFWSLDPVVRILMDVPYKVIQVLPR